VSLLSFLEPIPNPFVTANRARWRLNSSIDGNVTYLSRRFAGGATIGLATSHTFPSAEYPSGFSRTEAGNKKRHYERQRDLRNQQDRYAPGHGIAALIDGCEHQPNDGDDHDVALENLRDSQTPKRV
jgi:hypothetical protein